MGKIIEVGGELILSFGGTSYRLRVGQDDPNGTIAGEGTYHLRLSEENSGLYVKTATTTVWAPVFGDLVFLGYALSDAATTDIEAGTAVVSFRLPHGFLLQSVRAYLHKDYPSTVGPVQIDINDAADVSLLSTKLVIDQDETTSLTAVPAVLVTSPTALLDDALLTVDIDTAGTGARGLVLQLIGRLN